MELIIVTGMSGAGKSTAMETLEDFGFFCADNVPPTMIDKFVELHQRAGSNASKMALGTDSRSFEHLEDFADSLRKLSLMETNYRMIFLDANDTVLLNRYKENRRNHPLLKGNVKNLEEAIRNERELLKEIRLDTEYVIDTSYLNNKELRKQISDIVEKAKSSEMLVQTMSFGFKYGMPMEPDLLFDVRCLPNPFYIPELKFKTGLDKEVSDFVLSSPESRELRTKLFDLIDFLLPLYKAEGKSRLVIAFGCTGGKHRSVTFAEEIYAHLKNKEENIVVFHRDIERKEH